MARVKSKDTRPELVVRRLAHAAGYRFRLHRRDLPGVPDLVFPARGRIIFVHGCFWHRHEVPGCWRSRLPKSRQAFWLAKLEGNVARDARCMAALAALGWLVMVVWECETIPSRRPELAARLRAFLGEHGAQSDAGFRGR